MTGQTVVGLGSAAVVGEQRQSAAKANASARLSVIDLAGFEQFAIVQPEWDLDRRGGHAVQTSGGKRFGIEGEVPLNSSVPTIE